MPVQLDMPTILEDETVFIRHAGELRFDDVREKVEHLLSFRFQNELNHVQFMDGYSKAHHGHPSFVEGNRSLLYEWERQGKRAHKLGIELDDLGVDQRGLFDEANYTLDGGRHVQPLFATLVEDWEDMLVWRWLRAQAWCYRSMVEFGSVYVPLSQFAFDQYFDLGLSRWPAGLATDAIEEVGELYRSGAYDRVVSSLQRWYPLALDFVGHGAEQQDEMIDLRVWTRELTSCRSLFEARIAADLAAVGIPARLAQS